MRVDGWRFATVCSVHTVKRACRVGYLAYYGTLVHALKTTGTEGTFNLNVLPARLEDSLSFSWATDYLWHAGVVLMPEVENLLTWFDSIDTGLSDTWLEHWGSLNSAARRRSLDSVR
jgi:hypothetical protein